MLRQLVGGIIALAGGVFFFLAVFNSSDTVNWAPLATYCVGLGFALILFGKIAELQKAIDTLKTQLPIQENKPT